MCVARGIPIAGTSGVHLVQTLIIRTPYFIRYHFSAEETIGCSACHGLDDVSFACRPVANDARVSVVDNKKEKDTHQRCLVALVAIID